MEIMHGKCDEKKCILFEGAPAAAVYRLIGMTEQERKEINSLFDEKGNPAVFQRCAVLRKNGYLLEFDGFSRFGREKISIFEENLDLIHPHLVFIMGDLIQNYFFEYENETPLRIVANHLIKADPHGITRPKVKYPYLLKSFLYAAYCGMNAVALWDGERKETLASLAMKKEGEDLSFYAHDASFVKSYLYDHCFLEAPTTEERCGNYGEIYQKDGVYYFCLNIQIGLKF